MAGDNRSIQPDVAPAYDGQSACCSELDDTHGHAAQDPEGRAPDDAPGEASSRDAHKASCRHDHDGPYDHDHAQGMAGVHSHGSPGEVSGARLLITVGLNLLIPAAQVVGGILANSVALLSDAVHNFSDFAALLIAYGAWRIGRRGATSRHTFGFRRVEILAALLNVLILVGACSVILYEAVDRFRHPQDVSGLWVMALAAVGVVGNGFSALLLHRDASHNLNVRGAFLHMVGDLLTSVAVLVTGAVLMVRPWTWLDPLLSVVIVAFILKNCWAVLQEAVAVLLNAAPRHVDIARVKESLEALPGVLNAHYLHAWQVSSSSIAFSCHLVVPDQKLSEGEQVRRLAQELLRHRFGIDHPIIQLETQWCGNGSLLCEMSCQGGTGAAACADPVAPAVPVAGPEKAVSWEDAEKDSGRFSQAAVTALRLLLGLVFLFAAYEKILNPLDFAQTVFNYHLLPSWAVNAVALGLPWLEALIGVCLMAGFVLPGALTLATGLLGIFLVSLVFNILRGLDVDCGCFGAGDSSGSGSMKVSAVRDAVLFVAAAVTTRQVTKRHKTLAGGKGSVLCEKETMRAQA
uniref:Cation diffusion facilitator family transporter n=1 Tax=Desulfacinum infernum TaxID=35837 RepID=A0A832A295_9BACT